VYKTSDLISVINKTTSSGLTSVPVATNVTVTAILKSFSFLKSLISIVESPAEYVIFLTKFSGSSLFGNFSLNTSLTASTISSVCLSFLAKIKVFGMYSHFSSLSGYKSVYIESLYSEMTFFI